MTQLQQIQSHWKACRAKLSENGEESESAAIGETPVTKLMSQDGTKLLETHQLLSLLMEVRDLLEPLNQAAKEKRCLLKQIEQHDPIRVGTLLGFSRRLGPNSRPPPEYNDPSGVDAFCVPGYLFPCPDQQMLLRSMLFLGGASKAVLRCIPPDIDVELQAGTTSVNRLILTSATKGAQFYYSINQEPLKKYNPEQKPILTAPGDFSLQAYATAEGYLPSEMSMKLVKLKLVALQQDGQVASVSQGKSSVFGGLFLGGEDDSEESSDEED